MQDVLDRFLAAESDVYLILQLKDGAETTDVRFESFARLEQMGKTPNPAHYEVVYFANNPGVLLRHEQRGGIGRTVPHVQFEASAGF